MATKTKEELEELDNLTGVKPRYPRKYEPVISIVIVVCAILVLGFAIIQSGFFG